MEYTICYDFDDTYNDKKVSGEYEYVVDVDVDDVIDYEFTTKYSKPYFNNVEWCLEEDAKTFVSSIESKYWKNKLNIKDYFENDKFIMYLKESNYEDALESFYYELYNI